MESLKLYVREGDRPRAGDNGNHYHPRTTHFVRYSLKRKKGRLP